LDSQYRLDAYEYASQIAHESPYTYAPHEELYKQIFRLVTVSDLIQQHQNALLFPQFFLQIDQEFCDHMLSNGYESFVLPLFSLLFAYFKIDILRENFPHTRHGKAAGCVSNLP